MFNDIQLTMTRAFPFAINQWAEMMASIKRIQDFLLLDEREEDLSFVNEKEVDGTERKRRGGVSHKMEGSVSLHKVTARWMREEEDILLDITLKVSQSENIIPLFRR